MTWMNDLKKVVLFVAIANLSYFGVEFLAALSADSVSLFADSIDFLEDAAVNFLIFASLFWSASRKAKVGRVLAIIILIPAVAAIATAVQKLYSGALPEAAALTWVGLGAMCINGLCAVLLARVKSHVGSLSKAAFLSARNDVFANILIVIAGFLTTAFVSYWPDLIVGAIIAVMNADAAKEVWEAATEEAKVRS